MASCSAIRSSSSAHNRVFAWNITFLDADENEFAGVYQHPRDSFLTFRDVLAELRLCFDFDSPADFPGSLSLWDSTGACFHEDAGDEAANQRIPVAADGGSTAYAVAQHKRDECCLPPSPLAAHIQAGCARRAQPKRSPKRPYLPIREKQRDLPTNLPFRSSRPGSRSPRKRPRSGSTSPEKSSIADSEDVGDVDPDALKDAAGDPDLLAKIQQFRAAALARNNCCAITGLGRGWTLAGGVGPGVRACHIVPQTQYNLYPRSYPGPPGAGSGDGSGNRRDEQGDLDANLASVEFLRKAWENTWARGNSILLLNHVHELFDARFLSIHPDTHRIRIFAPYDVLEPYHGKVANFSRAGVPDRRALGQHWDICCMENMMAALPSVASPSGSSPSLSRNGLALTSTTRLPQRQIEQDAREPRKGATEIRLAPFAERGGGIGAAERTEDKAGRSGPGFPGLSFDCASPPTLTQGGGSSDEGDEVASSAANEARADEDRADKARIKRRMLAFDTSELTKENERHFLADVDFKLRMWKQAGEP